MPCSNIYHDRQVPLKGEDFSTLLEEKNVVIKRILSSSKISQDWMIQEEDEWFIILEGSATIMIAQERKKLQKGDYCFLQAKQAHRLLDVAEGTLWLAVHF